MNIPALYELFLQHSSIQTDTRKLREGDIFFALRGPRFDANAFAREALDRGAAYAVVDDPHFAGADPRIILTEDVLQTLQELSRHHRQQHPIPLLAITGSNGKTTTKELIHAVLSTRYRVCTTEGNLNNHIGVPLTLLRIRKDTEIAVIEMGANHSGEIASYCHWALPDLGLITNIGRAHLEGFGGLEGVRKGKGELYDHLRAHGGGAFVWWDDPTLREMSRGIERIYKYGAADSSARNLATDPWLRMEVKGRVLTTRLVGSYNFPNVLAALAVGEYFNVDDQDMLAAIAAYTPRNSRSQWVESGGNRFILDAYNANPTSMRAAIEDFARLDAPNKVVVLGGMAELGTESREAHQEIADLLASYSWQDVALVGGDFPDIRTRFTRLPDAGAAAAWLKDRNFQNATILLKGSRTIGLERVLEA